MLAETDLVLRLVVAVALGAIVGLERQLDEIPAGLRTHILICLGSALFTILSFEFTGAFDPSRIASGIVTGIGFLGAGAIFMAENRVHGLTTAADVWVVAAIGMAAGLGYFLAAAVTSALVFVVLLLKKLSKGKV